MSALPDISVIIVNWRSADFLRKSLKSISANSFGFSFETIVVDNASYDGSEEMLKTEYPAATFIQATENLGFARANNLGYKHSTGRILLFLNPDTEVVGDSLKRLLDVLDLNPGIGAVGPKLLNTDGSLQYSVQAFPTITNQVLDAHYLQTKFPRSRLWGMKALFDEGDAPKPVDALSGACVMVQRTAFEQVGRFTESYFMYAEDVDLCYKMKMAGWKTYFVGCSTVVHHGGQSSDASEEKNFSNVLQRESRYLFFREHRGRAYANTYRCAVTAAAITRLIIIGFLATISAGGGRRAKLLLAARKWAGILRWSMGMETWTKKLTGSAT